MKLTIDWNEETNQISASTDKPIQIDDMMTLLFTMQLQAMNDVRHNAELDTSLTDQQRQDIIETIYDNFNAGASNVLYLFCPDEELHPDLTVEAMKEAEDRYMYNHLNRSTRRQIDKKTHGETKIYRFPTNQNRQKETK